jgi:two-component sensor histidine kinase
MSRGGIPPALDRLLGRYDGAEPIVRMKVRFFIAIAAAGLPLLIAATLVTFGLRSSGPEFGGPEGLAILMIEGAALAFAGGTILVVLRGKFAPAAHVLLCFLFASIWIVMAIDRSGGIICFDTIVFVFAVMMATPLAPARSGIPILIYGAGNAAALVAFVAVRGGGLGLVGQAVPEYLADNLVSLSFATMAAFAVFSINARALSSAKLSEDRLKAAVAEKDALLRELYHRTMNNMQMVSSMLSLASGKIGSDGDRGMLDEIRNRIYAMSLAHEMLYDSRDLSLVPMGGYAKDLAQLLLRGYGAEGRVEVVVEAEGIGLPIDAAIPCGLVLNELLSNAIRHAFPAARSGRILVRMSGMPDGRVELVVADDGAGVPPGFDFRRDKGLGIETALLLAESQLGGELEFSSARGVECRVRFRPSATAPSL